MTSSPLVVSREGAIGVVQLNRPEARNALSNELLRELVRELEKLDAAGVRCAVVTGNDRVFAAGADLRVLQLAASDPGSYLRERRRSWDRLRQIRMPLVAAVAGFCLGGGFELALACDIVIAADNATFGLPETGLGLIPGAGGTQRLPRVLGKAKAMDVILTGRRLSATEAETAGIAARVVALAELDSEARSVAATIADRSAVCERLAKAAVINAFELPLSEGLESEREAFAQALGSADAGEGIAAFLEKRDPSWSNI